MIREGPNKAIETSQIVSVSAGTAVTGTSCSVDGLALTPVKWGRIVPSAPSEVLRPLLSPFYALSRLLVFRL